MKVYLLFIFSIIASCLYAQVVKEPVYFNSPVTKSDSLKIDSVWKIFKRALLEKDSSKVKAMSVRNFSLSLIKPGKSLAFPIETGSIDGAVDSLFRIVHEGDFFQTIDKSFIRLNALAAAESNKPEDYESLDPVIFSILFTQLPLGSVGNKGWSFAFTKSEGKIKFSGLTQL